MSLTIDPALELKPPVTAEDLERLSAEGRRYELIYGELFPMSPVGGPQGRATARLLSRANVWVMDHGLGEGFTSETGFEIYRTPKTILAPDWAFIAAGRLPKVPQGFPKITPDLVLETRSPNDTRGEVAGKIALWLRHGAKVVWDLDPGRGVLAIHRQEGPVTYLRAGDTLTEEELLPGFSLALSGIF
jgi:Uma2 family endonuclease